MENYICITCGVQYDATAQPPERCIICDDERQYVGWNGQRWTTLAEMRQADYHNDIRPLEPNLHGIGTQRTFAIGQRGLLVQTPSGNLLWDCISYIDQETVDQVNALGGIAAIATSHPHFYGSMVEWSQAFGGATVYVPEADAEWVTRKDPNIRYWKEVVEVLPGVTIVQTGGHFEGSAVAHWASGMDGRGALLVGDTVQVVQDRRFVSFMRSYPNIIPLSEKAIRDLLAAIEPYPFDRMYGGWWDRNVLQDGQQALQSSADRYIRYITD